VAERRALAAAARAAVALLAVLQAGRLAVAARAVAAPAPTGDVDGITVLVPVRSGDPLLATTLIRSTAALAPARVVLLADEDDPAGLAAAEAARRAGPHVEVRRCPPPPAGANPKVHKLAEAAPGAGSRLLLLDDDTVLPPGGLARLAGELRGADLVTGVPVYAEQGGLWSRLVAAFVNGSALPTYLPLARTGPPVTVNGMVLLTRQDALRAVGGLAAVVDATCDDYALARAYRAHGLRIVQSAQPVHLATTVAGPLAYARLMRRWLLFGSEVLRRDAGPRLAVLAVLPAALPALAVGLAAASRSPRALAAAAGVLAGSALGTRRLRRRLGRTGTGALGVVLEPVAALLLPVHALAAALGPRRVLWRGRSVAVGLGSGPGAGRSRPGADR
jgi:ceramide glucosyltransferase